MPEDPKGVPRGRGGLNFYENPAPLGADFRLRADLSLSAAQAEPALAILRGHAVSAQAARIGIVSKTPAALVTLKSRIGTKRILDMHSGEQLPRIC